MKKFLLILLFSLIIPVQVYAQATPSKLLAWDQTGATLVEAAAMTYTVYKDGATTGTVVSPTVCVVGPPVQCEVPFPAFTPGAHTLTLSATNLAGESLKSTPFPFTFVVVPNAPTNLRIK